MWHTKEGDRNRLGSDLIELCPVILRKGLFQDIASSAMTNEDDWPGGGLSSSSMLSQTFQESVSPLDEPKISHFIACLQVSLICGLR